MNDIEYYSVNRNPWEKFPALKALLRDRIDWDTGKPMIDVELEHCFPSNPDNKKSKPICKQTDVVKLGPKMVQDGSIFTKFNELWQEEGSPLIVKKEQLEESYLNSRVLNILSHVWE